MKQLLLIIIIGLTIAGQSYAQETADNPPTLSTNLWKAHILAPGLEYERRLGDKSTLNVNPHLRLGYGYGGSFGSIWVAQPMLDIQYRQYYNLDRQHAKGKATARNSGSFFALSVFGATRSLIDAEGTQSQFQYGIGPLWGMQRTYDNRLNASLQLGGVYTRTAAGGQNVLPQIRVRLGFVLQKK